MIRESKVRLGEATLNVMTGPDAGPPLLLLHGVIRCWQTFLPLLPALAQRWTVHGLDFPGHGGSATSTGGYAVADYVRVTSDFIQQQFGEPVVVYGHSLGAMVAAGVASSLGSGRVAAAILEDPPLDTMGRRIRQTRLHSYFAGLTQWAGSQRPVSEVARELAELVTIDPATLEPQRLGDVRDPAQLRFLASCLKRLDPAVLQPIVAERWLEGYDWRQTFRGLACPALLVQADESAGGMLIAAEAAEAQVLAGDCTLARLPGCGHNIHSTKTQDLANLVLAFLESL
jgi:pimeloyl-ACP methyl ester carboxylesterase